MEEIAADLWNPMGGYLPAIGHTVSKCKIRNAQPTEPQMVTDEFLRSHTSILSNVGLSHVDVFNEGVDSECEIRNVQPTEPQMVTDTFLRSHNFTPSNVGLSHADAFNEGVNSECEIRNVQPTELQMVTDIHFFSLSQLHAFKRRPLTCR